MPVTLLPNFRTLSEFGSYHGDCGELATLAALHPLDPASWPLTLAFLDQMVADELRQGLADPSLSGGQNIPAIDTYLTRRGIAHTTVGYAAFNLDVLHSDLKANAGVHPVIVEWSNAGALPGDEAGVHFHYSTCGGIDTGAAGDGVGGAYLWADGDNSASTKADGGSDPIRYSWPQVVAAVPIGYIIITQAAKVSVAMAGIPNGWHDDGTTLTAPNGVPVTLGFRDHILAAPVWPAALLPEATAYGTSDGGDRQDFRLVLDWHQATNVTEQYVSRPTPPPPAPADPTAAPLRAALAAFLAGK